MENVRFDDLAMAIAGEDTSRRSLMQRIAGGGFAAALAALGITGFEPEDADARSKRRCKRRCKKKNSKRKRRKCRKRCKRKGNNSPPDPAGFPIEIDIDLVGDTCTTNDDCGTDDGSGLTCVGSPPTAVCLPTDLGTACTSGADCATGNCVLNLCAECTDLSICGSGANAQCCVVDATCVEDLCVLPQ